MFRLNNCSSFVENKKTAIKFANIIGFSRVAAFALKNELKKRKIRD